MSWLIQVVDDGRRIAARGWITGVIERRIEPSITGHAGARCVVEDGCPARRCDGTSCHATVRPNRDANTYAPFDLVADCTRRILFLNASGPASQTVRSSAAGL